MLAGWPDDALGDSMAARRLGDRVLVTGASGSGKTTLSQALAAERGVPHIELDALHHMTDWQPRPTDELRAMVDEAAPADGAWVVDGTYHSKVGDLVWSRAQTVVFLDLPRWRVMTQLVPRTLWRGLSRRELWNGNRESLRNALSRDRERNIVLWSWTTHAHRREVVEEAAADPRHAHVDLVRLRSRRDVRALLSDVAGR